MDEIVTRSAQIHAASSWLLSFDEPARAPSSSHDEFFAYAPKPDLGDEPTPLFGFAETEPEQVDLAPDVDVDELRRTLEAEMATALQKQKEEHDEALRLARLQWLEEEADALGQRMTQSFGGAFETLRSDVARILAPFVAREIEEMAQAELIDATRRAFADQDAPAIRLEGPRDLIERIARAFADQSAAVTLIEADSIDVKIDLSHTRLETRLDDWMRRLNDSRSGAQ
jgi:hypothetical protein